MRLGWLGVGPLRIFRDSPADRGSVASEPVPLTLFIQHPDRLPDPLPTIISDPLGVAAVTGLGERRGLAQVAPQTIRLHRVPAALLRDRDTPSALMSH